MTPSDIISFLSLPPESRIDRRVPKSMLLENGIVVAADRRRINEGIESIEWIAALKPSSCGIPANRDTNREYLEIIVLSVTLRPEAKTSRLVDLVHRAVPYPVVLITTQPNTFSLSLAHKRNSLAESSEVIVDGEIVTVELAEGSESAVFLESLSLQNQPGTNLHTVYKGWMECLFVYQASLITGVFRKTTTPEESKERREALKEHRRLAHNRPSYRHALSLAT